MMIEENPNNVTSADIVVGLPSYNEASFIQYPTQQADLGLRRYYAGVSAVIVNVDNHSPDGTGKAFLQTQTDTPKIYLSTDQGVRGKGNNLRNLFRKAVDLSAKAVAVVDADLKSITPRWIRNLVEPIFENYQFVAPLYVRHKYDGAITNNVAYPLTRALYGRRVRQPIGGDYGFSGELARTFAETEAWSPRIASFGIDMWMTSVAMRSGGSVVQSFMGRPKIHKPKTTEEILSDMFQDVVGTIFELMRHFEDFWKEVRWSRPTAVYGFGVGDVEVPPAVNVDTSRLWKDFLAGIHENWDRYREILQPQNLNKLEEVAGLPEIGYEFPTGLWARILYDFAVTHKTGVGPANDLLALLAPLFEGKTLSFVLETEPMNTQQVEEYIEDQCLQFEKTKPYLVEQWFSN